MNNTSCILTVIKNEHEYLDEWIKYHIDLGIDHIFIFEDIDSDSHKEICDRYGDRVSLDNVFSILDEETRNVVVELKHTKRNNPQDIYFRNGLSYIKEIGQYDWCFVIDNDEFITLENESNNLNNILRLYERYDAFVMQWKCYGANGFVKKPDYTNKGVVETYTKEIQGYVPAINPSVLSKTCFNMNNYKEQYYFTNHQPSDRCNFCRTNFKKDRNSKIYDNIYIRHYITKSWEEYVWKRKTRGYFVGKIKSFDFFFKVNSDMNDKKEKLINDLKKEVLVVLPYKQNNSQGNEIRLALKSWRKFCRFKYHFVVIGEFDMSLKNEFPWVEFISVKILYNIKGQYIPHIDIQRKMKIVMEKYDRVYDGFIYMVDDNYAIKPFDLKDVSTVFYHSSGFVGREDQPTWYWNHDKWKTRQLLDKENLPHINYTTHHPYYLEFKKLNEIWKKFNMLNESYVFDDVYFNYFKHEEPVLDSEIRFGVWNKKTFDEDFNKAIEKPNIKFVCNSVDGWSKELENELSKIIEGTV